MRGLKTPSLPKERNNMNKPAILVSCLFTLITISGCASSKVSTLQLNDILAMNSRNESEAYV